MPKTAELNYFKIKDVIEVVHSVSLNLGRGQIGCLLGPSGCGKSSLLRAIAGFEPLVSGEIKMDGKTLSKQGRGISPEDRGVGMVFQDLALFPHISIAENIAFGLRDWNEDDKAIRVREMLELVGMPEMGDRYPQSLSGGQQQRVALARAASRREVLVPEVREMLLKEEMSALLVTHDQMEAFAMADKVAVMNKGEILQVDTAYNLYHEPANRFVADFVGEGEFLGGIVLNETDVQTSLGVLKDEDGHGYAVNQSVEVFVRPDDLFTLCTV